MAALRLVYRRPRYGALGVIAFAVMALVNLWSSQVLLVSAGRVSLFLDLRFLVAALVLATLFGLLLPMQIYALRLAVAGVLQPGGTVLGALLGTASMTCCAPVLLPSLLALLGYSGTTILSVNLTVNRFWLPLATLSAILLTYALISCVSTLDLECRLPPE